LHEPAFVAAIEPESGTVRLGKEHDLLHTGARLGDARFFGGVSLPTRASAQVRYRHGAVPATLSRDDLGVPVDFDEPGRAGATGQPPVGDAGGRGLGGGTIVRALRGGTA